MKTRNSLRVKNDKTGREFVEILRNVLRPYGYYIRARGRGVNKRGKVYYKSLTGPSRPLMGSHRYIDIPPKYAQELAVYFNRKSHT